MQTIPSNEDIIIKIPRRFYDKRVQDLIDYIEFKTIVSKSKAGQKEVDAIMKDIKMGRKELMKPLLEKIKRKAK